MHTHNHTHTTHIRMHTHTNVWIKAISGNQALRPAHLVNKVAKWQFNNNGMYNCSSSLYIAAYSIGQTLSTSFLATTWYQFLFLPVVLLIMIMIIFQSSYLAATRYLSLFLPVIFSYTIDSTLLGSIHFYSPGCFNLKWFLQCSYKGRFEWKFQHFCTCSSNMSKITNLTTLFM